MRTLEEQEWFNTMVVGQPDAATGGTRNGGRKGDGKNERIRIRREERAATRSETGGRRSGRTTTTETGRGVEVRQDGEDAAEGEKPPESGGGGESLKHRSKQSGGAQIEVFEGVCCLPCGKGLLSQKGNGGIGDGGRSERRRRQWRQGGAHIAGGSGRPGGHGMLGFGGPGGVTERPKFHSDQIVVETLRQHLAPQRNLIRTVLLRLVPAKLATTRGPNFPACRPHIFQESHDIGKRAQLFFPASLRSPTCLMIRRVISQEPRELDGLFPASASENYLNLGLLARILL
ncbi:hypothetical protein C8R45DRAFT_941642 [Mycena sanguinolenta]|nr:hypothetical protein C8R45DRAFT_941642 [Mycena sanguinolenta]